ncbi:MAG: STAS domain-containing protein [Deltaproteobacteria bacterium]|nr:STAS domain-containing protein [Deltaproteobacteria bacterium]MBT4266168.1 STAS domain-containing protein [Deltaproteobacteria bacterium]MBT4639403.1 STAS domain-containing protein [Deltaproteobacteria bacterium]MBT6615041.1 STAS domain-containing protein [Deltaproteobacteria bacterium]MBT7155666.1 STAS domain-containing protein [Deltaproteobacteria bacterium]
MRIEESVHGGIGILSIIGDLAVEEAAELKKLTTPYLEENKFTGLIWNLKSVRYIDSSGLGLIVSFFKSLKGLNKKFALADLNSKSREMLNISKLDKFLVIAKNNESALKILQD